MDEKLLRKLRAEDSISAEEALRLDASLDSAEQLAVRTVVESATGDWIPSLAWRSELNEKLALAASHKRRHRILQFGSAGAVAAAVVAVALMIGSPGVEAPPSLGSELADPPPVTASLEDVLLLDQEYAMAEESMGIYVPIDGATLDY